MLMLLLAKTNTPPPQWFFLLFGGMLVAIVLIAVLSKRYERKRSEALAAAAFHHGLSFNLQGEPFSNVESAPIELFNSGRKRQAGNLMRGISGGNEVTLFDYEYVTGSGKNQSHHKQTVAAFRLPGAGLPAFQLRHECWVLKIAAALGYQDINFPEHPEFSRRYILRGKDESAVRVAFSPALIDFFEQLAAGNKWWTVEGGGDLLVVYRPEKRVPPEQLAEFLQESTTVAVQFPQVSTARFGH